MDKQSKKSVQKKSVQKKQFKKIPFIELPLILQKKALIMFRCPFFEKAKIKNKSAENTHLEDLWNMLTADYQHQCVNDWVDSYKHEYSTCKLFMSDLKTNFKRTKRTKYRPSILDLLKKELFKDRLPHLAKR